MKFSVIDTSEKSQTAWMTLAPGEGSGPKENEHASSEQVLYVVEGELHAEVGERQFRLGAGESVIVRKGVAHRFENRSKRSAITFNVYCPPAY
ncbi:MAG TPA: cupin domain-containing protein [Candidatus Baltobacteraceae bacterium]|jgi:mannose-6-phosphate isomerase-like protein (cupin superfamily)|nr:cupin domain-containing protein [Candidatus Baltobacteraceae bacterium]